MQTERRVAANPQTKPTDLGCESADKWLLSSIIRHKAFVNILCFSNLFTIKNVAETDKNFIVLVPSIYSVNQSLTVWRY